MYWYINTLQPMEVQHILFEYSVLFNLVPKQLCFLQARPSYIPGIIPLTFYVYCGLASLVL